MAESSWPSAAPATVTEHDFERLMSAYYQSGLVGDPSLPDLVYGDSTGLQIKVRANRLAQVRGFTWTSGPTELTVPIAANASGSTRIDRAVLRLDKSTWTVAVTVIQGTPGAGPPAISQDTGASGEWDLMVANSVTVINGAGTIAATDVDARSTYLGAQLAIADQGKLLTVMPTHFFRYAPNEDRLDFHTQGAVAGGRRTLWEDSGEVLLATSNGNWENSVATAIRKINNTVELRYGSAVRTGGTLGVNADSVLPGVVPADMRHPTRNMYATVRMTGGDAGRVTIKNGADPSPGRIHLTEHAGVSSGQFVSGFTITWLVP